MKAWTALARVARRSKTSPLEMQARGTGQQDLPDQRSVASNARAAATLARNASAREEDATPRHWSASASTRERAIGAPATIAALLVQGYTRPATPWLGSGPCTGPSLGQAPAPAASGRNASRGGPAPISPPVIGTTDIPEAITARPPAHPQTTAHLLGQLPVSADGSETMSAEACATGVCRAR